jgi:diaminopimelate epimerase
MIIIKGEKDMSIEILKEAIAQRMPIAFEYNKPGKTSGVRVGNPHAVFIMQKKDGSESTKVHVVQTGGVSDSGQEFPSFRMFNLTELSNVEIEETDTPFDISEDYNPMWDGYSHAIAKV